MKTLFSLLVFFLFFSVHSIAQKNTLVGDWIYSDMDGELQLILDKNGYTTFVTDGEAMGGEPHEDEDGEMQWAKYRIDNSTSPKTIIITIHSEYEGEIDEYDVYGLFEIQDEGQTMKMCLNFEEDGPLTEFDEEDTVIFERME